MSGFESIIDQKQPLRILTTLLRNGAIPHALLFTGIEGVGKRTAAMAFAMACNCLGPLPGHAGEQDGKDFRYSKKSYTTSPCGGCKSCRKIQSGNHPDVIQIQPSGPLIRIAQIRALLSALTLKPYEAEMRVVIISDAQTMNPEASNALLKALEEPPDRTLLILTCLQTSDLLPTIVSRCQQIRFNPISRRNLAAMLVTQQGLDPKGAAVIAAMSNGSFSKALSMIRPPDPSSWIARRNWLINALGFDGAGFLSSKTVGLILAFAEKLFMNKEALPDSLEVLKSWFRDLVIYKYFPDKIINQDLTDSIQYASQQVTVASLLSKIEAIQTAQKHIQANANLRLTLEVMALKLAKV